MIEPTVKSQLGKNKKGKVKLTLPFDRRIDSIKLWVRLKDDCEVKISNLKIELIEGEFSQEWKNRYGKRIIEDKELVQQLQLMGKVWGFLKYHSPIITKEDIDWDRVLLNQIDSLFTKSSQEPFQAVLTRMINLVCTGEPVEGQCNDVIKRATGQEKVNINYDWISASALLDSDMKNKLSLLKRNYIPFKNKYALPSERTSKPAPIFVEDQYNKNSLPEMKYRLLALFRYWNIIEYYDPYRYLVKDEWENYLKDAIPRFILANNSKKYSKELLKLNASIKDGHAAIPNDAYFFVNYVFNKPQLPIPLGLEIIEDDVFVKSIDSSFAAKTGMAIGDRIFAINGYNINAIMDTLHQFISDPRVEMKNFYISKYNLLGYASPSNDSLTLEYSHDNKRKNVSISYTFANVKEYKTFFRKKNILSGRVNKRAYELLNNNTLYLNCQQWDSIYADTTRKILKSAKNVVIDCRDYPNWDFIRFSSCFIKDSVDFVKFMFTKDYPGLLKEVVNKAYPDSSLYFSGNVVVLISEETRSRSEMLVMLLKARDENITFIGRTTAGADGDITAIPMVGQQGMSFVFSGLRVLFPDDRETQGVGIKPDVFVERNVSELTGHGDPVLKKALDLLK